ncbi:HD-GYP domain-containing protein [Ethanoligenens harbinense]|uniref:Metal dependent phosphohydrolase n=1 Tax=Ethanoligenens harbinense (strain DSM 18485 / JCM 12961 / CGMCC 1.5033 / YUAN-3) TaxID=663278 RepID=E6U9W3_ETHHY|nr:HD-GYP domain-containing protein [Ethanoligenens harbinense]ADU26229.1 metal dependent phosphohydrolase [Ethanoligenens harbinense YUAN-3]AVQ95364.1 HD-GYP domain-containing protein [Ethanoligenens harbinense YUAN-3]AYF38030.1 HD-GYP domain-containing protein [Ethanoligenens harbinense]AYF40775.1 HD-GYP domain-containing protein [Ethanoligenens harbinense]QCN91606.1 HD-GYP domain-containing protein [Ethanoligenens harbinense]
MQDTVTLPKKVYKALIIAAGVCTLAYLTATSPFSGNWWPFLFLCLLAIVTETQTILIGAVGFSITIAVILCAMLTCNITETAWISALSVLGTYSSGRDRRSLTIFNIPVSATLFNASSYELSLLAAYAVYRALGGYILPLGISFNTVMRDINGIALPLIVSIFVFVMADTVIVSIFMYLRYRENFAKIWVSNLPRMVMSTFFVGLIGIIITAVYIAYGWFLVLVLFVPFLLARYVFSMYKDLQENYLQTITSLSTAIETKDSYTNGHSRRVEFYSGIIAVELGLSSRHCQMLRYAALLHDIGKIAVDESILHKVDPLTKEEMEVLRRHPANGEHILEEIKFLSCAAKIIRSHHEWYNGEGYPDGLSGKAIPLEAQILAVADSYDAMTSDRPYRRAFSHEEAMTELFACAGSQFAPEIVSAFEKAMKKRGDKPYVI